MDGSDVRQLWLVTTQKDIELWQDRGTQLGRVAYHVRTLLDESRLRNLEHEFENLIWEINRYTRNRGRVVKWFR